MYKIYFWYHFLPLMGSIEEEEQIILYLEQLDNKFYLIKNILRKIKNKIHKLSYINSIINSNCLPWIKFFNLHLPENKLEMNDLSNLKDSTIFDNLSINENTTIFKENYSDNHELKLSTIELNLNENFSDTNKKENGFVDTVPLDLKSIPTTLANESILIQIYNYVKEKKQVDFENVKKHFNNVPEKKINIIINFLINRNHIIKKNNKLQYN